MRKNAKKKTRNSRTGRERSRQKFNQTRESFIEEMGHTRAGGEGPCQPMLQLLTSLYNGELTAGTGKLKIRQSATTGPTTPCPGLICRKSMSYI